MAILRKGPFVDSNLDAVDVPTMGNGYPNAFTGTYPVTCADNGWVGEDWEGYYYKESLINPIGSPPSFNEQFDGLFNLGDTITTVSATTTQLQEIAVSVVVIAFRYQATQDFDMRIVHSSGAGDGFLTRIFVGPNQSSAYKIYEDTTSSGSHDFTVPAQVAPDNVVYAFCQAYTNRTSFPVTAGPSSITLTSI